MVEYDNLWEFCDDVISLCYWLRVLRLSVRQKLTTGQTRNSDRLTRAFLQQKAGSAVREGGSLGQYTVQSERKFDIYWADPLLYSWLWCLRRHYRCRGPGACLVCPRWRCCSILSVIPGRSYRVSSGLCAHAGVKVNFLGDGLQLESCASGPPKVAEQSGAGSGG